MQKNQRPVQQMSLADFLKAAQAIPLSDKNRNFEIRLGDQFIGFESGIPAQAMARAHERAVREALDCNMPDAAPWLKRPMPSPLAVEAYPELEERYCFVLESKREATV